MRWVGFPDHLGSGCSEARHAVCATSRGEVECGIPSGGGVGGLFQGDSETPRPGRVNVAAEAAGRLRKEWARTTGQMLLSF